MPFQRRCRDAWTDDVDQRAFCLPPDLRRARLYLYTAGVCWVLHGYQFEVY